MSTEPTAGALSQFLRDKTDYERPEEFWEAVQRSIKDRLGLERYSIWFGQTELMSGDDRRLVVGVPNVIIQQFLTARYAVVVAAVVGELLGRPMDVSFDVAPRLFRRMRAQRRAQLLEDEPEAAALVRLQRPPALQQPEYSFDDLIVASANRLTYAAARELAGQEKPRFRFLYICADYGLGKTVLLRAMFALACGPERGLEPVCLSAEQWCNEYYHAIQSKTTRAFRSRYRSCNMLLLDDVQFVQSKPAGQVELVHTVKHILGKGGRVALSGTLHPGELRGIGPELRALLRGAFPVVMVAPREEERLEIVRQLAARRALAATEEVYRLMAQSYGESFRRMESAIACLALYAGVEGCGKVQLPHALEALAALHPPAGPAVGLAGIKKAVLEVFPVRAEQLTGSSRSRTVCRARQVAIYLARKLTGASLTEIGLFFGGRTHSTVKHAVDKIAEETSRDSRLAALVERLETKLGGSSLRHPGGGA